MSRSRRASPGSLGALAPAAGRALVWAALGLAATACTPGALRGGPANVRIPYAHSTLIRAVSWDFSDMPAQRKALGSDLWPCAWAIDGDLYCAWGDGGGFDGNADNVGRVSLGFARIAGTPAVGDPSAITGVNIWGAPPYALVSASFGGKVGSMIAVDGVLYAAGGFWTSADKREPTRASGRGPRNSIAWSVDSARSWQLADWSSAEPLGSFLDQGQDSSTHALSEVFAYYLRSGDSRHVYLKRTRREQLLADPARPGTSEYFAGLRFWSRLPKWSSLESQAVPVFTDRNNVEGPSAVYDAPLGRYLLTAGHYVSGNDDDSSAGQVGLFESPQPWGPWATIGYYEDWGGLKAETTGDFLSLRMPSKWFSADGRSFWAVFSGLKSFDSFNLAKGVLELR
jgi:hypothetical protein